MLFEVSAHLEYHANFPSTMILNVHAQRNIAQTILQEEFSITPKTKVTEFMIEGSDNRFVRLETGASKRLAVDYSATVDCDFHTYQARSVEPTPVAEWTLAGLNVGHA